MTYQPATISYDRNTLPKLPPWVTSEGEQTLQSVAFRSGAALTMLDALVADPSHGVPVPLLANVLALKAATATSRLEGRLAQETDIRDAYHFTPPDAARGPDGDLLEFWRDAARMNAMDAGALACSEFADDAGRWAKEAHAKAETHGPLAGCAAALQSVLTAENRAERAACLLCDSVLAQALNWPVLLPICAQRLTKAALRGLATGGQGAELMVQAQVLEAIQKTIQIAQGLAQRSQALQAVAPKLRAKGSSAAVALFLREDAVSPSTMLSPFVQGTSIPMTDRAARRFCDRLVELGVARELTGRTTFRLYGVAP